MDFARAENTSRRYLDLILEANKRTNLTRITSREEAEVLHLEDSWVGLPEINRAPDGRYGDLGSGGGFPGVICKEYFLNLPTFCFISLLLSSTLFFSHDFL